MNQQKKEAQQVDQEFDRPIPFFIEGQDDPFGGFGQQPSSTVTADFGNSQTASVNYQTAGQQVNGYGNDFSMSGSQYQPYDAPMAQQFSSNQNADVASFHFESNGVPQQQQQVPQSDPFGQNYSSSNDPLPYDQQQNFDFTDQFQAQQYQQNGDADGGTQDQDDDFGYLDDFEVEQLLKADYDRHQDIDLNDSNTENVVIGAQQVQSLSGQQNQFKGDPVDAMTDDLDQLVLSHTPQRTVTAQKPDVSQPVKASEVFQAVQGQHVPATNGDHFEQDNKAEQLFEEDKFDEQQYEPSTSFDFKAGDGDQLANEAPPGYMAGDYAQSEYGDQSQNAQQQQEFEPNHFNQQNVSGYQSDASHAVNNQGYQSDTFQRDLSPQKSVKSPPGGSTVKQALSVTSQYSGTYSHNQSVDQAYGGYDYNAPNGSYQYASDSSYNYQYQQQPQSQSYDHQQYSYGQQSQSVLSDGHNQQKSFPQSEDDIQSSVSHRATTVDSKPCGKCKKMNDKEANFCSKCGSALASVMSPDEAVQPQNGPSALPQRLLSPPNRSSFGSLDSKFSRYSAPTYYNIDQNSYSEMPQGDYANGYANDQGYTAGAGAYTGVHTQGNEQQQNQEIPQQSLTPQPPTDDRSWRKGCALLSFGFGGKMMCMFPKQSTRYMSVNGRMQQVSKLYPGMVAVHNMSKLVDSAFTQIITLNGPVGKLKKKDLLKFISDHQSASFQDDHVLWSLLKVVAESDGKVLASGLSQAVLSKVLESDKLQSLDLQMSTPTPHLDALNEVRALLMQGKRSDCIPLLLRAHLYDHALIIAAHCSKEVYNDVLVAVAAQSADGDPLKVLYQSFTGHIQVSPDVDYSQSWRQIVTTILANKPAQESICLMQLGDILARQNIHTSHLCYLLASSSQDALALKIQMLGVRRLQLIHGIKPGDLAMSEVFEHYQQLAFGSVSPYLVGCKLWMAALLIDAGHSAIAGKYCEAVVSQIKQFNKPSPYVNPQVMKLLQSMSEQLSSSGTAIQSGGDGSWLAKMPQGIFDAFDRGLTKIIGVESEQQQQQQSQIQQQKRADTLTMKKDTTMQSSTMSASGGGISPSSKSEQSQNLYSSSATSQQVPQAYGYSDQLYGGYGYDAQSLASTGNQQMPQQSTFTAQSMSNSMYDSQKNPVKTYQEQQLPPQQLQQEPSQSGTVSDPYQSQQSYGVYSYQQQQVVTTVNQGQEMYSGSQTYQQYGQFQQQYSGYKSFDEQGQFQKPTGESNTDDQTQYGYQQQQDLNAGNVSQAQNIDQVPKQPQSAAPQTLKAEHKGEDTSVYQQFSDPQPLQDQSVIQSEFEQAPNQYQEQQQHTAPQTAYNQGQQYQEQQKSDGDSYLDDLGFGNNSLSKNKPDNQRDGGTQQKSEQTGGASTQSDAQSGGDSAKQETNADGSIITTLSRALSFLRRDKSNASNTSQSSAGGGTGSSAGGPKQVNLGEKSKFYYDPVLKKWVNEAAPKDNDDKDKQPIAPPPKMSMTRPPSAQPPLQSYSTGSLVSQSTPNSRMTTPVPPSSLVGAAGGNNSGSESNMQFPQSRKMGTLRRNARSRYVDTFNPSSNDGSSVASSARNSSSSFLPPTASAMVSDQGDSAEQS
ncbi:hypothetical protein MP228_007165 [Amoeboaphelidium protococcarum]|nr:hypothetical protein MP228_007165 [Amoeboaphelidium protococcarum]